MEIATAPAQVNWGGFAVGSLRSLAGDDLFLRPGDKQLAGHIGLTVRAGFDRGVPVAFMITDLWADHPTPWVQPVYVPPSSPPMERPTTTFGVDTQTGFYSPFWRMYFYEPRSGETVPQDGYPDVDALLAHANQPVDGPLTLCPIHPDGMQVASTEGTPLQPLTRQPLKLPRLGRARARGATVEYFGTDGERFSATDDGLPVESPIYFFADAKGGLLDLPAVMPDGAMRRSFTRVFAIDATGLGAYVPASLPTERNLLSDAGVVLPTNADPQLEQAAGLPYLMRVTSTPGCLEAGGGFPLSCRWVDSESAVAELGSQRVQSTGTTLSSPLLEYAP